MSTTALGYSSSYPYLGIARRHGVDYGLVLSYADLVQLRSSSEVRWTREPTCWEQSYRFNEESQWASDVRRTTLELRESYKKPGPSDGYTGKTVMRVSVCCYREGGTCDTPVECVNAGYCFHAAVAGGHHR